MRKADFENLLQGVRELKAARRGALPVGSILDRHLTGSRTAFGKNVVVHGRGSGRPSSTASRRTPLAP
jgi:hypothetical protein